MSFKDENESLTGVALGHTAFTSVPPKGEYKGDTAPKKRGPKPQRTRKEQAEYALLTEAEKAERLLQAQYKAADTRRRNKELKEAAITAKQNVSSFNVQIATPDDSRKTQSIARTK